MGRNFFASFTVSHYSGAECPDADITLRISTELFLMRDLFLTYQTSGRFAGAGAVLRLRAERMGRRLLGPIGGSRRKRAP